MDQNTQLTTISSNPLPPQKHNKPAFSAIICNCFKWILVGLIIITANILHTNNQFWFYLPLFKVTVENACSQVYVDRNMITVKEQLTMVAKWFWRPSGDMQQCLCRVNWKTCVVWLKVLVYGNLSGKTEKSRHSLSKKRQFHNRDSNRLSPAYYSKA